MSVGRIFPNANVKGVFACSAIFSVAIINRRAPTIGCLQLAGPSILQVYLEVSNRPRIHDIVAVPGRHGRSELRKRKQTNFVSDDNRVFKQIGRIARVEWLYMLLNIGEGG